MSGESWENLASGKAAVKEEDGQKVVDYSGDGPKDSAPKGTPRIKGAATVKAPSLEDRLVEFFGSMHQTEDNFIYYDGIAGLASLLDPRDAMLIAGHGPTMAKAWADLADESPRVRRVLEMLLTGGAWGGVMIATLPVAMGIMMNHNMMPQGGLFGPKPQEEDGEPVSGTGSEPAGAAPRDPRASTERSVD